MKADLVLGLWIGLCALATIGTIAVAVEIIRDSVRDHRRQP